MRIASFIVPDKSKSPNPQTPDSGLVPSPDTQANPQYQTITGLAYPLKTKGSVFNIQRRLKIIRVNLGIMNNHEPLSSTDPPSPPLANWFKGDDYIYHRVNGLWKRSSISKFNSNG